MVLRLRWAGYINQMDENKLTRRNLKYEAEENQSYNEWGG